MTKSAAAANATKRSVGHRKNVTIWRNDPEATKRLARIASPIVARTGACVTG
jgi:hypothetical protein